MVGLPPMQLVYSEWEIRDRQTIKQTKGVQDKKKGEWKKSQDMDAEDIHNEMHWLCTAVQQTRDSSSNFSVHLVHIYHVLDTVSRFDPL